MSAHLWTLRVTSGSGRSARVTSRSHQFTVTRPLTFDVEHDGLSALEYALGALGAELATGLRELARRRRLELDNVEVVVSGELRNALVYLEVVGESGDPGLSRVALKVYVESRESEDTVRALCRDAMEVLPLARTFRTLTHVDLEVVYTP